MSYHVNVQLVDVFGLQDLEEVILQISVDTYTVVIIDDRNDECVYLWWRWWSVVNK